MKTIQRERSILPTTLCGERDASAAKRYRTTPLRGIWARQKGGFFHDGRFATLLDVVNHYDTFFQLGLTDMQKTDLVEYLKSL